MQEFKNVLSPLCIGSIELKNRIEFAPACCCLATPDGFVTKELIEYYQNIARGGAGIVTIGETPVNYGFARRHEYQLNIGDEGVTVGLCYLAEAVQRYGAKLSIELSHSGSKRLGLPEAISSSAVVPRLEEILAKAEGRKKTKVIEMTQDMIDDVIDDFANAAQRCLRAGMEMIMIHGAHGHLLSQFTSPYYNKRTDSYGGSLENRARFAIELLSEIRNRVGNKLAIEYRICANERVPGGMLEDESIAFAKLIEDKVDLLHVSSSVLSTPESSQYLIQPTYMPHCPNVHYAEKFKKELKVPIATVGSISDMQSAEDIVKEGKADVIAMARAIMADPEIVNKTRRGLNHEVKPCLRCNHCTLQTRNNLPIRCAVNPVLGRENDYVTIDYAKKKKKVLVVGGGPAGMQAALTSSARGHEVTLYEKTDVLGGNLILAAGPAFKEDMRRYLNWLIKTVEKDPNVTLKLETEATAGQIEAENPDAVLVAIGADPILPEEMTIGKENVVWAGDVHAHKIRLGDNVVVVGGGLTGLEAALHMAQEGKKVTIVDMLDMRTLTGDIPRNLLTLLAEHGARLMTEVKVEQINDDGVTVVDKAWKKTKLSADTVVLSLGFTPRKQLNDVYMSIIPDVYFIGDCEKPIDLKKAIHDAFNVAVEL